jgi:tetratricopeptide (TPR) repeat protein
LSCSGIGKALIGLGRVEQARLALRGSVKTLSNCNDKLSLAVARTALAEALSTMGKYEQALGQLEQAYNEFEKLGRSEKALLTQASIGDVLVRMKKPEQAREPVEQAMTSAEATSGKVLSRLLQVQAHLCGLAGDWQNAETHARGAVAAASLSDDKTERALAAKALSRVYLSQGREVEAVAELSRALAEIKPGTKMILELEIKALLSRAIYPIDPQQAYRLINDVQEEIKGRDLPVLREACIEALARIEAGPPDNFFVLSDKPLPTLSVARDQLARWLVRRALSQSEGSADKAGEKLRITGTHIRNLLRRIREGKKLYRSADEGRRSKKSEPAQK